MTSNLKYFINIGEVSERDRTLLIADCQLRICSSDRIDADDERATLLKIRNRQLAIGNVLSSSLVAVPDLRPCALLATLHASATRDFLRITSRSLLNNSAFVFSDFCERTSSENRCWG